MQNTILTPVGMRRHYLQDCMLRLKSCSYGATANVALSAHTRSTATGHRDTQLQEDLSHIYAHYGPS